jgi:hypothetical protein
LLEEAIALVRHAPARAWSWYLAGAIPFFAALLFFVRATTGRLAVPDPAAGSFALAVLFGWRQLSRSVYGRVLMSQITGVQAVSSPALWIRAALRTWFAGFLRVLAILPVPYLSVLFRNYQAYAWDEEFAFQRASATASRGLNPLVAWLTLSVMGVCVWLNIITGMVAGPLLFRIFTGEETVLTKDVNAILNRTVLISSLMIAWCLCDVVLEAMCVLQRFYGESEETGTDLMRAWRKGISGMVKAAGVGVIALSMAAGSSAQVTTASSAPDLNRAIDEVLSAQQYQWREAPAQTGSDSKLVQWMRSIARSVRRGVRAILRPLGRLFDAFMRWLRGRASGDADGPAPPVNALRFASVLVFVLLAGLLVALLLRARARSRSVAGAVPTAGPIPVDLNDPNVSPIDLEEEQWLRLAKEWMEKGEPRMALRAWFLACLAWLNARELVTISRNKSNLDYRRELARRARGTPGLTEEFGASVRSFESAWYGEYPVDASEVERFAAGIAHMRNLAA